jgi:hypothetical protein
VTQASSQWQRWVNQVWHNLDLLWLSKSFRRANEAIEQWKGWLLCLTIGLLLLIWNWQLVVSGGVGLGALVWVYLAHQGQWRLPIDWRKLWQPSQRPVTLAVVSGATVSAGTYVAIALWVETQGSWVSRVMLLQGAATLAMLLLLGWQTIDRYASNSSSNSSFDESCTFERLLGDLSDADALKRLIAVRRLTQWLLQSPTASAGDQNSASHKVSAPMTATHLAECFRLMLNRETDPAVCRALLDSLHQLNPQPRSLQSGRMPFSPAAPSQESIALPQHLTEN